MSNHGGNNLDGTPASIRALPAIADAVGDEIEVVLDGGIRRGSDVVKALALGARAVMIGRAYLWGLAANGQAGVENVLDIMRGGIDSALHGSRQGVGPRPGCRRHPGAAGIRPRHSAWRRTGAGEPVTRPVRGTRVAGGADVNLGSGAEKKIVERTLLISPTSSVSQMNSAYDRSVVFPTELGNSTSRQLRYVANVDRSGRFDRAARTSPAAGHRYPHRHRGRPCFRRHARRYRVPRIPRRCSGDRLRRQRRAPGVPRHGVDRHRRARAAAARVRPFGCEWA